jgi:hypothetical protein
MKEETLSKEECSSQDNPEISDTKCWVNHFRTKKEDVWIDCVLQILPCLPSKDKRVDCDRKLLQEEK